MAVATLLHLKDQRSLPFKRGRIMYLSIRHGIPTPRIHVWAPSHVSCEMCERPECDRHQQHCQNRDWPSLPTFVTFAGDKRKKEQANNYQHGADQECWRFERGWEQREQSIDPQEKVIRFGNSLDYCRIWPSGWPKWTEEQRARGDRQDYESREEHIFPDGVGNERRPISLCKLVVLVCIGRSFPDASRDRRLVEAQHT